MDALVYEPESVELDGLEDALTSAFETITLAASAGRPVVIVLDDRDVQGNGEPSSAALAHGLLGLARALAIEGRGPGWRVSVISATAEVADDDRARWIAQLGDPGQLTGALVRLGSDHLGRLTA
jgi:hypothetical protein